MQRAYWLGCPECKREYHGLVKHRCACCGAVLELKSAQLNRPVLRDDLLRHIRLLTDDPI